MKSPLFVAPGNAIILKDFENERYVGIAYSGMSGKVPVFATISERVSGEMPYAFVLSHIAESLEIGLMERGKKITCPVVFREANCAIITGDGKHYAVGVNSGHLQYALPEGKVTDEQLDRGLMDKMRCPDRR